MEDDFAAIFVLVPWEVHSRVLDSSNIHWHPPGFYTCILAHALSSWKHVAFLVVFWLLVMPQASFCSVHLLFHFARWKGKIQAALTLSTLLHWATLRLEPEMRSYFAAWALELIDFLIWKLFHSLLLQCHANIIQKPIFIHQLNSWL